MSTGDDRTADGSTTPRRGRVCFSFAAYAKSVVAHLCSSGVPVVPGLSDAEFAAVESAYGFDFPPDLRSILCEGLPVGPGFPNWRSASSQQLRLLLDLPVAGLLHEIAAGSFWPVAWGPRPQDPQVVAAARYALHRAPPLVPVYRHYYVSTAPSLAGNPVFYVRGGHVRLAGLDLPDFFRRERPRGWAAGVPAPAWAATSARRVEVWTELAEGETTVERQRGVSPWETTVERRLGEARRRLTEGGWSDEEVREMVAAGPESDDGDRAWFSSPANSGVPVLRDREGVSRQLQLLSLRLLRGGWSYDDVVDSMGWTRSDAAGGEVTIGPRTKQTQNHGNRG